MNGVEHAAPTEQYAMDSYFLTHGKYAPSPGEKQQTLTWVYHIINKGLKVLTPGISLFTKHLKLNLLSETQWLLVSLIPTNPPPTSMMRGKFCVM